MLSPDLLTTLIVLSWGALAATFGYFAGKRAADENLLDELDESARLIERLAKERHPSTRNTWSPLTDAELDAFLRQLKAEQ